MAEFRSEIIVGINMDYFVWDIDPIAISVGFAKIRWYGLMFASAFISSYLLMTWMYKREGKNIEEIDDLLTYAAVGTVVGARLGHCLFYNPEYYFDHPFKILAIWEGGLASHGAILGILLALYLYQRKVQETYVWFIDRVAIVSALGASFIRMGNFFNSEIYGEPTTVPWAVVFGNIDATPRHAVQLYEAIAYSAIFISLFVTYKFTQVKHHTGATLGLLLFLVFSSRFLLEFIKTKQASYSTDLIMTTGQLLSIPFLFAGLTLILMSRRKHKARVTNNKTTRPKG